MNDILTTNENLEGQLRINRKLNISFSPPLIGCNEPIYTYLVQDNQMFLQLL
jgi:hypothetical protein